MSTTGRPSREKLEEYYKTSRQYFDDMAEHYKESDLEYYNSTIAPIIRRNRRLDEGYDASNVKKGLVITVAAAIMVLGMAMAVFFMLAPGKPETNPVDEMYEKMNEDGTQRTPAPIRETSPTIESNNDGSEDGLDVSMSNFEKGVFYYDQAAYDQAMKYFGQVKPGDPNYDQAQKYVSEISNMPDDERMGITPKEDSPKQNPIKK